jgi:hypothetical protein
MAWRRRLEIQRRGGHALWASEGAVRRRARAMECVRAEERETAAREERPVGRLWGVGREKETSSKLNEKGKRKARKIPRTPRSHITSWSPPVAAAGVVRIRFERFSEPIAHVQSISFPCGAYQPTEGGSQPTMSKASAHAPIDRPESTFFFF